jgi:hypothetical protein
MIRKVNCFEPSPADPTPDEIRERTAAIRQGWTPRERARRSGIKRIRWTPPVFRDVDLPAYLSGDYESR